MPKMTLDQVSTVLSTLASLDTLHSVSDQAKYATKVESWLGILDDCEYEPTMLALKAHYKDTNAKSITPAVLRMKAHQATPKQPVVPGTASDKERTERACRTQGCHCDHANCYDGWLDEETTREGRFGTYTAVQKCPICAEARAMAKEF